MKNLLLLVILFCLFSFDLFSQSRLQFAYGVNSQNFNESNYISSTFEDAVLGSENLYKILVSVWNNQVNSRGVIKVRIPSLGLSDITFYFNGTIDRDGQFAILYIKRNQDLNSYSEFIVDAIKWL